MCGIAGVYNFRSRASVNRATVEHMTRTLIHRGPDAEGFYLNGALGLGHRRLSILDLSERGCQPLVTQDSRYVISYNGEVYNYLVEPEKGRLVRMAPARIVEEVREVLTNPKPNPTPPPPVGWPSVGTDRDYFARTLPFLKLILVSRFG